MREFFFKTEQSDGKPMPFRIVLNTLLKISLEKTSFSCGLEQTCRHESFY